jgi:monothiol glutaredoxin
MSILGRIKRRVLGTPAKSAPQSASSQRATPPAYVPEPEPTSPRGDQDPTEYIEQVVKGNRVVLFMKGTPAAPACGFSANSAGLLRPLAPDLHTVDITVDPEVREQVKTYSSWPTLPQIFIDGEFVGGNDILQQLSDSGDLAKMLAQSPSESSAEGE